MIQWAKRVSMAGLFVGVFSLPFAMDAFAGKPKDPGAGGGVCQGLQKAINQQCELLRDGKGSKKALEQLLGVARDNQCKIRSCLIKPPVPEPGK